MQGPVNPLFFISSYNTFANCNQLFADSAKNLIGDNLLNITIVTDSLNLGNYHLDSTSLGPLALKYQGQTAGIVFSGDFFNVNITGYQNSRISGTFTAKLTPISDPYYGPPRQPGSIIITEGVFDSVQVIY